MSWIVWLEDNPALQLHLDMALDVEEDELPADLEVRYVTRKAEAVAAFRELDVVLMIADATLDVGAAPRENGIEVVRELREDGTIPETLPVVFRTGHPRSRFRVPVEEFPHWYTRDDEAFAQCVLELLG